MQEEHKREIEKLLTKLSETEARLDTVTREKRASDSSPGSRSPPHPLNLTRDKRLEERQSGEVNVRIVYRSMIDLVINSVHYFKQNTLLRTFFKCPLPSVPPVDSMYQQNIFIHNSFLQDAFCEKLRDDSKLFCVRV